MTVRVAAALVVGLGLAAGAAAPASATAPRAATGACGAVRVVVDYNELGGETRTGCVPPGTAAEAFDAAGVQLEYVPQLPDFVCRVSGLPGDGPCTDGDAYWSLWWSDGDADWTYASLSVSSLEVPPGGAVGFAWHEGADDAAPPDVTPAGVSQDPEAPENPEDPEDPEDPGGTGGTAGPDGPDGEDIVGEGDDALPWWAVTIAAVIVLGGALVPWLRRRRP